MSKRIAIQLFGHLRTYENTYKSIYENVVKPNQDNGYEVDIFIHTWNEKDHSDIVWHNPNGEVVDTLLKKKDIDLVCEIYKPIRILYEKQLEPKDKKLIKVQISDHDIPVKVMHNLCHTIYKANELRKKQEKETGKYYDWVISTRPDIVFLSQLKIDDFIDTYKKNNISLPQNAIFYGSDIFSRGDVEDERLIAASDLVFFAKPTNMDQVAEVYKKLPEYINRHEFWAGSVVFWIMQSWKAQHLIPIPINYRRYIDYDIMRDENFYLRTGRKKPTYKYRRKEIKSRLLRKMIKLLPYFLAERIIKH
jgi:hypothetical protein